LITSCDVVDGVATCEQHKRARRRACVVHKSHDVVCCAGKIRLYYNMTDFMNKFAEFVILRMLNCPMLYETKTQNTGEFA